MKESLPQSKKPELRPDLFDLYLKFENRRQEMNSLVCEGRDLNPMFLKEGDSLVIDSMGSLGARSFIYEVTGTQWPNLSISYSSPRKEIFGHVHGTLIPDGMSEIDELHLHGSVALNETSGAPFVIPGGSLYLSKYGSKDGEVATQFVMPTTDDYGVARISNVTKKMEIFKPDELININQEIEKKQHGAMQKIKSLMLNFGFERYDFFECQDELPLGGDFWDFHNKNFSAQYVQDSEFGNTLSVFNKKTQKMVVFKYINSEYQNMLQVAYVDLTHSSKFHPEQGDISVGGLVKADASVITHTLSPELDLDVVSYNMTDAEARAYLDMSVESQGLLIKPDIQLWPDGSVKLGTYDNMKMVEREKPGTIKSTAEKVKVKKSGDGHQVLILGRNEVEIQSLEEIFQELGV